MPSDVSIDDAPMRLIEIPAGAAFLSPPETTVRMRLATAVEMLAIGAGAARVEVIVARVAGERPWVPHVIEIFIDSGFAALRQELRRPLISDPLKEPAYLEALVGAGLARLACRTAGVPVGVETKEALPPDLLRRVLRTIDAELAGSVDRRSPCKGGGAQPLAHSPHFLNRNRGSVPRLHHRQTP